MDVLVKCVNHTTGCPWIGQLKNWENHTDECVFRTVKCPHKECELVLPFNQLESHQQTCQFRRVTCEYCNTETSVSQQEVTELTSVFSHKFKSPILLVGKLVGNILRK